MAETRSGSARGAGAARGTGEAAGDGTAGVRRLDNSFLTESAQAPWTLAVAKRQTSEFRKDWALADKRQAVDVHALGTALLTAHAAKVHLAFGLPSFAAWMAGEAGIQPRTGYRYMRLARFASERDLSLGYERCLLGASIAQLLGVRSLTELRRHDLPVPDGDPVRFPQPAPVLRAVLRMLGGDAADAEEVEEVEGTPDGAEARRRATTVIDEECASFPGAERYFKASLRSGRLVVRVAPVPVAEVGEIAKIFSRIARRLGR